jgi:Methyltransferase domain
MSIMNRIVRGLRNPAVAASVVHRFILVGGIHGDSECMNAVRSWASGRLPHVMLCDLFPGIERCGSILVKKPEARVIGFSLDLLELIHVISVAKFRGARTILEIGTFDGFTALNLAANIDREGKVYTVDLPKTAVRDDSDNPYAPYHVGSQFKGEPEAAKIEQLWADSTKADWQSFGGPFDLILIDGSHDYPDVKSDSANAFRHLRSGGTVFWHDYGHFLGVSKALDELARACPIAVIKGTRLACFRGNPDEMNQGGLLNNLSSTWHPKYKSA